MLTLDDVWTVSLLKPVQVLVESDLSTPRKTFSIALSPSATLVRQFAMECGVPSNSFYLRQNGHVLNGRATLAECKILDGTVLQALGRLKGGLPRVRVHFDEEAIASGEDSGDEENIQDDDNVELGNDMNNSENDSNEDTGIVRNSRSFHAAFDNQLESDGDDRASISNESGEIVDRSKSGNLFTKQYVEPLWNRFYSTLAQRLQTFGGTHGHKQGSIRLIFIMFVFRCCSLFTIIRRVMLLRL